MGPAIEVSGLTKAFAGRAVLDVPALTVAPGEMVGLIGPSGAGKSTLLRALAGLTRADGGTVAVGGAAIQAGRRLAPGARGVRAGIGFVFQQFNLVPRLKVETNVLVGCLHRLPAWRTLLGVFPAGERARAAAALARVGLADRLDQRTSTLSGGQRQRVAIARALTQGARVILADEPIASLDPESARGVMRVLTDLNRRDGITVLVSLHQVEVARAFCPRVVAMRGGRIVYDGPAAGLTPPLLAEIYGAATPVAVPEVPGPGWVAALA